MVDTAREAGAASQRRDAILQAVAFAAERLLLSEDWRDAVSDVLARLGDAAGASRSYLIENDTDADGDLCKTQIAEWCAPGIPTQSGTPLLTHAKWYGSGFGSWAAALEAGDVITGEPADFPDAVRTALETQDVRSVLILPVIVEGAWWGCVGLGDCARARTWSHGEVDALRTASALIGAAITRRAEHERLGAAEARHRSVVEHIPAVTYVVMLEPGAVRLGSVSPQIEALLGYPHERFLHEPNLWSDLIHPDDAPRVGVAIGANHLEPAASELEYRMRHADGHWVWVHDSTTPVRDEKGSISHLQGFLLDVTGRREADDRVRDAEERYRAVVEGIPAASYIDEPADAVGGIGARVTYMSPQVEGLLGYAPQRFLDEPGLWFALMHEEDLARLEAKGAFDVRDESPFDEEYRMRHADGHRIWVHDTSIAIYRADGSLAHFQGFMVDITARMEAEQRRADAEARYRSVVESIPAVTYVEEVAGDAEEPSARMTFVSPQIERITGVPADRFVQDQGLWLSLMHPDDLASLRASGTMNAANTGLWEAEYRMQGPDGGWVWVHDASVGVFREDGSLSHVQGWVADVTARHDAEERLDRAQERFRVLVEQMPAIVYTESLVPGTTRAARLDYVSPAAEAISGYTAQTWTEDADFWEEVVHPDDAVRVREAMEQVNETGEPLSIEYRIIAADGRTVWIHEEAILVRDDDGEPLHWQGLMLDITERTLAAEQIRVAEERFRTMVEHTRAITYQEQPWSSPEDPLSSMTYVSPQSERILGYPAAAWAEPGFWMSVTHPDDLPRVIDVSALSSATGSPYGQDYRMVALDGRVVWFHDEAELILDTDGQPLVWLGVMTDITERKAAEEQLRQARARLQAMIDHIPAVVYIEGLDAAPESFYISPQVERLFGHSAEEWTWTPGFWLDHVHPDDREAVLAEDHRSDEERQRYANEYRFRCSDGTYVWVHDEAAFVSTEDGEGFWQGFLYDITERKGAEERVSAAERVLRATVEQLPAVVYREPPTREGASTDRYISPAIEELIGCSTDGWLTGGRDAWVARLHPDDRVRLIEANDVATTTGEPFTQDYRLRREDGTYVWVHDEATFVQDPDGAAWWQGFLLDITERKEAEQRIQAGEARFRAIVEQSPAVIYTQEFDADAPSISKTTYISPRQPEILGYTVEETSADPAFWTGLIHPQDRERVLAADLVSNQAGDESFSLEYRMIAKDGRVVWVQDQANLVQVEGQPPFWQGFLLDITERKGAEEQLARALEVEREATRSLRALDEMKNTFLQAVSHDLRTPLAAILGLAITLERGDVHLDEDDAKDLAHRIAGNARRLDRMVANLLDLDRLARGIVTPKLQSIDVGTLVQRAIAESALVPEERLHLEIEHVQIPVDAAKVERIVENLVANTVRHTPEDSSIWVRVIAHDDGCLLTVEDDGPGVAEEMREAIFEPFRQGEDAPPHSPGVGVGLTLVRRFAELHGGKAWVQDREGGGASFRVLLPGPDPVES